MGNGANAQLDSPRIAVRAVTEAEVDFLFEHGWVHVPSLIDRDAARLLLDRAKAEFGEDGRRGLDETDKAEGYHAWFRARPDPLDDQLFNQLALSPDLGRNTARLLGRDGAIRLMVSSYMAKMPAGSQRGAPTDFHQDLCGHTYLEGNFLTAWVALDEITSDMAPMQFYSGSHRLGNLGQIAQPEIWDGWASLLERTCARSDPVAYRPGDATFHLAGTIHGTDQNRGDRPRWSWAGVLVPGDARYTGAANYITDGLDLVPGGMIDHPRFPITYAPQSND